MILVLKAQNSRSWCLWKSIIDEINIESNIKMKWICLYTKLTYH